MGTIPRANDKYVSSVAGTCGCRFGFEQDILTQVIPSRQFCAALLLWQKHKGKRLNFVTLRKRKGGDVGKRNGYKSH